MNANRREFLKNAAGGFGMLALAGMSAGETGVIDPLSPQLPHFAPKAKRVIFLYMTGGVSHVDTFDYKPKLISSAGKTIKVDNWQGKLGEFQRYLKKPNWDFHPNAKCGTMVSDLFPKVRQVADQLCIVRSMKSNHTNHYESTLGMHCGSWTFARPSLGSWVSYGLGTENQNLPSFMVIAPTDPYAGAQTWGNDFLPGCHQGTRIQPGSAPIPNLTRNSPSANLQKLELEFTAKANKAQALKKENAGALEARIRSFETAFGMQMEAPAIFDLSQETASTLKMYGVEPGKASGFGWQCLIARRLAEKGVRFIELIDTGSSNNWDSHGNMQDHVRLAANVDGAAAALITDLKQRGLLDETLVVWTTEFGRTPYHENATHPGREHHHQVFSSWMAGGGVKGGVTYGASDDFGIDVAEDKVHVHDFHATILHLMGLDHEKLVYRHAGRDFRLTDVEGQVIDGILA